MRAAFYETNITPPLGGYIWGSYNPHFGVDVDDEIYSKALVIENNGEIAAFVCVDTCVVPPDMHDFVTKRIEEYTGITPDRVCLSANHTHKGATIFDGPEIECFADETYKNVCYRLTADAVILAYKRLQDVKVYFDTVQVPGFCHNRTSIMPDGTYQTWIHNKDIEVSKLGSEDNTYSVMTFKAIDGTPIGILSSFPLHQDSTHQSGHYSGDYSSAISDTLKEKYGQDFVSLFLIGTCGDINSVDHDRTKKIDYYHQHRVIGSALGKKAIEIIEKEDNECTGDVKVIKELVTFKTRLPDNETARRELKELIKREKGAGMRTRNYMLYHTIATKETVDLYMQCVKIGDVCIHILPGEIFVDIGLAIKEASPFKKCIVVENSNSYCGYIPTKKAFEEGKNMLYETSLAKHSCLSMDACDTIYSKSIELSNKLL